MQDPNSVAPGTIAETKILIGARASGADIAIPVVIAKGRRAGPCLWISGQVHGDELNGVFVALDFVRSLDLEQLSGTVIVSATANPLAFDDRHRRAPQDYMDMDQTFPGHAEGSPTERMAAAFQAHVARYADCLVSMHTTMSTFNAVVFAAYKVPRDARVSEALMLRCMGQFNPTFVLPMPDHARPGDSTGVTAGSIDFQILALGKLAFMIELAGGGVCDEAVVAQGVGGLYGTARILGMLPGAPAPAAPLTKVTLFRGLTCNHGGLFRAAHPAGAAIHAAGVPFGTIVDLYGRQLEAATAASDYRIIAMRRAPAVDTGDRLVIAALEWCEVPVADQA